MALYDYTFDPDGQQAGFQQPQAPQAPPAPYQDQAPQAPQYPRNYNPDLAARAVKAGIPDYLAPYMGRLVHIESGGNPSAQTGQYTGMLQMGRDERARYGGDSLDAGLNMYADNYKNFRKQMGRDPTPTEFYMVGQQGLGGITSHLKNPDQPAWMSMYQTAEGQKKGAAWAKRAIWGNVPTDLRGQFPGGVDDPNLTSANFVNSVWKNKVEGGGTSVAPTQVASNDAPTAFQAAMRSGQNTNMSDQSNQYAYAPNYDPNAGLFDRLRAGGPGALFGAPNGTFAGANGRAGYALGNKLQQAAIFGLAVNNPGALSALPGIAARNDKHVTQIGTDEYGNPKYAAVDNQGNVSPLNPVGTSGANGVDQSAGTTVGGNSLTGPSGLTSAVTDVQAGKMKPEELLTDPRIPANLRAEAKSIIEGTQTYSQTALQRTPQGKMLQTLLSAAAPGEDLTGRQAASKAWAEKNPELVRRLSQAAQHGSELTDAFDAMHNTDYPAVNSVKNFVGEQAGWGAPTALRSNINQFATELATFTGGNTISDKRYHEWADSFPVNGSPEQQKAAMAKGAQLFEDSMTAFRDKQKAAFGSYADKRGDPVPPAAKAALAKMKAWASGGSGASSSGLPTGVKSIQVIQ